MAKKQKKTTKRKEGLLPTEKSEALSNLEQQTTTLYGPPKIGKTTLISEIPNCLILDTEAGTKNLSVYRKIIDSWDTFKQTVRALRDEDHDFTTVAIDTIDRLYNMCMKYCGRKYDFDYPSDEEYGKGWDIVRNEFMYVLDVLHTLPGMGLWIVSHSKQSVVMTRTMQISKTEPTMTGQAIRVVSPMSEIILCAGFTIDDDGDEQRVLYARPSHSMMAGDKTKRLLRHKWIPLSYAALVQAFEKAPEDVDFESYFTGKPKPKRSAKKRRK